jgi:hypothetical protein
MDEVEKIVRAPSIEGVEIVRKGPNGERIVLWEDPLYPQIYGRDISLPFGGSAVRGQRRALLVIAERVSDQSKPASNNRN